MTQTLQTALGHLGPSNSVRLKPPRPLQNGGFRSHLVRVRLVWGIPFFPNSNKNRSSGRPPIPLVFGSIAVSPDWPVLRFEQRPRDEDVRAQRFCQEVLQPLRRALGVEAARGETNTELREGPARDSGNSHGRRSSISTNQQSVSCYPYIQVLL